MLQIMYPKNPDECDHPVDKLNASRWGYQETVDKIIWQSMALQCGDCGETVWTGKPEDCKAEIDWSDGSVIRMGEE